MLSSRDREGAVTVNDFPPLPHGRGSFFHKRGAWERGWLTRLYFGSTIVACLIVSKPGYFLSRNALPFS